MLKRRAARDEGFTLIELMVSVGILAVIVTALMGSFTFQHQTYMVVDQVSETQQNTRAISALLERDLRSAGFMVSPAAATCGVDSTTAADLLFVSDADAIRTVDDLPAVLAAQELGADVGAVPTISGVGFAVQVDDVVVDGEATYDTNGDGTADSDFQVGGGAILVDAANLSSGSVCGTVTAVNLGTPNRVTVAFASGMTALATTAELALVPAHVYSVSATNPPELRRNGQLLAKDVEDMQLAWFFDLDEDGQVGANEYQGVTGTPYDSNEATGRADGSMLREVRVNLVLRTRSDDVRNPTASGTGQGRENRTTGSLPGDDGRRRRVHTTTIRIRNVPTI